MTIHDKTNDIALGLNLRYEPNKLPTVIIIDIHILACIDRGIIPLHKNLLQNTILTLTKLWLKEVSCVATLTVHDTEPLP